MKVEATEQEREALRRWYGDEEAPRMEAMFASASEDAYDEAVSLAGPTFPPGDSKRAARIAAWDIINRAREAAVVAGGAR